MITDTYQNERKAQDDWVHEVKSAAMRIRFLPTWELRWDVLNMEPGDEATRATKDYGQIPVVKFRWTFERPDAITMRMGYGRSGDALLTYDNYHTDAVAEQVVKTVFGLAARTLDHEAREFFRYEGERIFNPHKPLIGG